MKNENDASRLSRSLKFDTPMKNVNVASSLSTDNDIFDILPQAKKRKYFMKNLDKTFDSKALHDTFSTVGHILFCEMATVGSGQSKVTQSHVNAGLISEPTMVLRDLRETQCGAISSCNNSSFSNHQTRQILEYKKEENRMEISNHQVIGICEIILEDVRALIQTEAKQSHVISDKEKKNKTLFI
ncbi:hypothetical protein KIW84_020160 [Lathyrus oleraceus]|uniref:RRM domain-containing protein n=1 Tax=Pisum sativum TaxID=3888 RepID=A0A9D4Y497_PEA|nr:hypothetical protein KIW84_020160 [Pisum sativum]